MWFFAVGYSPGRVGLMGWGDEDLVGTGLIGGGFRGKRELFQLDFNGFHGVFPLLCHISKAGFPVILVIDVIENR